MGQGCGSHMPESFITIYVPSNNLSLFIWTQWSINAFMQLQIMQNSFVWCYESSERSGEDSCRQVALMHSSPNYIHLPIISITEDEVSMN